MATIMLTLHGFLLTSWILIHPLLLLSHGVAPVSAKTTLMLGSSSSGVDNGDIFAVSSGPRQHQQQQQQRGVEVSLPSDANAIGQQRGEDAEDVVKEYHPPLGGGANVNKSPAHKCPVECTCGRDNDQRWEVLCLRGNSYKSCCASILDGRYAIRVHWWVVVQAGQHRYRVDDGREMYLLVNIRTCVVGAGKIKLINGPVPDNLANLMLAEAVTIAVVRPLGSRPGEAEREKVGGNEI